MTDMLRIIAGRVGGRTIHARLGPRLRPTPEKVRGAVFNHIGGSISGSRFLDGYAGSGANALEALSRGAALAMAVERDRAAARRIVENAEALGLAESLTVLPLALEGRATASRLVQDGPWDFVYLAPPWPQMRRMGPETPLARFLTRLVTDGLLATTGQVLIEHPQGRWRPTLPLELATQEQWSWGDTGVVRITLTPSSHGR